MLIKANARALITACVPFFITNPTFADTGAPTFGEDPALWGEEEKLYTATKFITQLKKAPVVATVITEQQIENMSARNLIDILKLVPGLSVSVGRSEYIFDIETRGTKVDYSTNVLILIDGYAANDLYYASGAVEYIDYPVHLIKRIEVVRSPGSALYGTGAFGAIINIITKENIGVGENNFYFSGATHNRAEGSFLSMQTLNKLKIRAFVNCVRSGDGDLFVEQDASGRSGALLDGLSRSDDRSRRNSNLITMHTQTTPFKILEMVKQTISLQASHVIELTPGSILRQITTSI